MFACVCVGGERALEIHLLSKGVLAWKSMGTGKRGHGNHSFLSPGNCQTNLHCLPHPFKTLTSNNSPLHFWTKHHCSINNPSTLSPHSCIFINILLLKHMFHYFYIFASSRHIMHTNDTFNYYIPNFSI